MKLGARTLKTGGAILCALLLNELFGLENPAFSAVAAFLAMQPSIEKSMKHVKEQVLANIIGAAVATLALHFIGNEPYIVALVVMLLIGINVQLGVKNLSVIVLVAIAIMEVREDNTLLYAGFRFLSVSLGIASGTIVNILFPPKHEKKLYGRIKSSNESISLLLRSIVQGNLEQKVYNKERKKVMKALKETEELFDLYREERYFTKNKSKRMLRRKRLVIFREMIELLEKQLMLLQVIEQERINIKKLPKKYRANMQQQLLYLTSYNEKLFMFYEEKMKPQAEGERVLSKHVSEEIEGNNEFFMEEFVHLYKERTDASELHFLFPLTASILDTTEEMLKVESLIENYRKHKKRKEK